MNKPSDIAYKGISTEEEFIHLVEQLAVGVIKHLPDASITLANKKALELLGLTKDQLIGKTPFDPSWHIINEQGEEMPGQSHPAAIALLTKTPVRNVIMGVYRPLTKDRVWILTSAVPELDQFENIKQGIVTFSEVSELKRKEILLNENNRMVKGILDSSYDMIIVYNEKGEELLKSRRLFRFSTEVNDLILNAKEPLDLYNGICDIAVNIGGFEFAFVGLRDDINEKIVPYKYAGKEAGYLDFFKEHISIKNIPEGNGPSGRTIRDGKLYYCNDISTDPAMIIWRDEALKRGFKSSLTMPVRVDNYTIAQIAIYANKENFFTNEELELMTRINENINYAMNNFAIAEKHQTAQNKLVTLSQAIEQSTTAIMITDVNGFFEYVNPAFCLSSGYNLNELRGVKTNILKSGFTTESEYQNIWEKNKNKRLAEIAWEQSHLVRAPLARILGMINLFQNDFISTEEKSTYLNYLKVSAEELDAVIKAIAIKTND